LYKREPALYEIDFHWEGFEWIDFHDFENSIIAFIRHAKDRNDYLVFVCNFTPAPHAAYRIGLPELVEYQEIFNSDAEVFGGSNTGNGGRVSAEPIASHGKPASAQLILPPLGVLVLKPERSVRPTE
jgi:1,4-alpha-glucan branching enzyme